ncbi:TolC family protein [Cognatiluteimonas profundi]|uniref:TolC family protein n=1 Tax=Cognatiluteimonas profundi TaxID=2594501 RepID=UPI00131D3117|nr:TolC family protein [Lysobacter profundi]
MALLACVLSALGSACVSTPMPDLAVPLPDRWQHGPAGAPVAAMADARWWRALGDRRLDALEEQALGANLDVAQAAARLRAARALSGHAGDSLRPDFHIRTTDPVDPDASASYIVVGFDSVWELGLFGRGTAIHRMARADLQEAKADVGDAELSLAAEVARQWVLLRGAQERASLLGDIRDRRVEQARLIHARQRLQLAMPQEGAQADVDVAKAEMALAEPGEAIATASQALAVLAGRSEPDPDWMRPGATPAAPDLRAEGPPADLIRQRPDIARAQAAVLAAAGALGMAKAAMYPNVAIGGSLVQSTSLAERTQKSTGSIGAFGPLIDIPLFDWGMRRATADAKGELLKAATYAYRKSVLDAVAEVETSLAALEQQRMREQEGERALHALDAVDRATASRHRLGLASGLDVAASQVDRDEMALEVAGARSSRAIDYVAVCKALGGAAGLPSTATAERNP